MDLAYWKLIFTLYLVTILVETPVLLVGLSRRHPLRHRLFAGVWLTACTYPVVGVVLPAVFDPRTERLAYLVVAETFAPAAECLLFYLAFGQAGPRTRRALVQDMGAVVVANLMSFGLGEWANEHDFFTKLPW